jgi:hypothetical protein
LLGAGSREARDRLLVPACRRYRSHTLEDVAPAVGRAREAHGAVRAAGTAELRTGRARSEDIAVAMPHAVIALHARALRVALGRPDLGKPDNIGEPAIDRRASTTPGPGGTSDSCASTFPGIAPASGTTPGAPCRTSSRSGTTRSSATARSSGAAPGHNSTATTATPYGTSSDATAAWECDADSVDRRRFRVARQTHEANAARAAAAPLGAERTGATPVATSPRV